MEANKVKLLSMIGLAKKAGKVICGSPLICEAMGKKGRIQLVVIASDASEQSVKKLTVKSDFYSIKYVVIPASKAELSHSVGKENELAALAITDNGFATELLKLSGKEASDKNGSAE